MQCSNNLKQLGLSLHNFHDAQNRFPCGYWDPMVCQAYGIPGTGWDTKLPWAEHINAFVILTPYFEQQAIYDQVTTCLARAKQKYSSGTTDDRYVPIPREAMVKDDDGTLVSGPYAVSLSALGCPSDGNFKTLNDGTVVGRTNYCLNTHADQWAAWDWSGRGVFRQAHPTHSGGARTLASITDGTSNTMMLSEQVTTNGQNDSKIKSGFVNSTDFRTNAINPADCSKVRGAGGQLDPSKVGGGSLDAGWNGTWGGKGRIWSSTQQLYSTFFTILPPNSPTCRANDDAWVLTAASSNHTGGVNSVFADGSVHFVSETVDPGDINNHMGYPDAHGNCANFKGPSTFGVWGAIGTIDGAESKSL